MKELETKYSNNRYTYHVYYVVSIIPNTLQVLPRLILATTL